MFHTWRRNRRCCHRRCQELKGAATLEIWMSFFVHQSAWFNPKISPEGIFLFSMFKFFMVINQSWMVFFRLIRLNNSRTLMGKFIRLLFLHIFLFNGSFFHYSIPWFSFNDVVMGKLVHGFFFSLLCSMHFIWYLI